VWSISITWVAERPQRVLVPGRPGTFATTARSGTSPSRLARDHHAFWYPGELGRPRPQRILVPRADRSTGDHDALRRMGAGNNTDRNASVSPAVQGCRHAATAAITPGSVAPLHARGMTSSRRLPSTFASGERTPLPAARWPSRALLPRLAPRCTAGSTLQAPAIRPITTCSRPRSACPGCATSSIAKPTSSCTRRGRSERRRRC
jgi:hypothetical protein